ncbi:MAG: hypothetical protein KC766_23170 [Myxococcales bacterium]|nr:hypothetical protein [Myxococcales bacterium]
MKPGSDGVVPPVFALPLEDLADVLKKAAARCFERSFAAASAPRFSGHELHIEPQAECTRDARQSVQQEVSVTCRA